MSRVVDQWGCSGGGFGAFYEVTVLEGGAVADEGDEVGCGDRAPAGLGGLDELPRPGCRPRG